MESSAGGSLIYIERQDLTELVYSDIYLYSYIGMLTPLNKECTERTSLEGKTKGIITCTKTGKYTVDKYLIP